MNKRIMTGKNRGFTLIELMVTVAILVIVIALAAPSFQDTIKRNRVQSEQRDLLLEVNYARSEAVSRGSSVGVCGSNDGATCSGSSDWSDGWIIFVDDGTGATASDAVVGGTEEVLRVYQYDGENSLIAVDTDGNNIYGFSIGARGYLQTVSGASSGPASSKIEFTICEPGDDNRYARGVLIDLTGRAVGSGDTDNNGIHDFGTGANFSC